ncbi:DNA-directed DNA polymerase [Alicyclobacillus sacchari]|nr:DNA-directed DNA polymerase [Alicyclobacillus sacchari]
MEDGSHLTVLVETREGFRHLCELLTIMHAQEGGRMQPRLAEADLFRLSEGLIVLSGCRHGQLQQALSKQEYGRARHWVERYREIFGHRLYVELVADGYPGYVSRMRLLSELSSCTGVPLVATSDVHAANKPLFPVQDVLRCIALGCDVYTPHPGRPLNRMGWLHDADEAAVRFAEFPKAVARTVEVADRCTAVFPIGKTLFPTYRTEDGRGGYPLLEQLVFAGARERYGRLDGITMARLQHELDIIRELGYVDYFLVVWDIVRFARSRGIRCTGRGSAADSAVAYCLYITDVDAAGRGLLFERFMSLERAERPDIDIDFASDRRDEVIDYVYHRYGQERVARVATYQTFRGRSAVRDIGAALALPEDLLDALAKRVPWSTHADQLEDALRRVPELQAFQEYRERLSWLFAIARHIAGFPRHFGMHSGGIVISSSPLFEVTSLQPSASGHWITPYDKRMLEDAGLVKLDLLSLRTMSAIEGAIRESSKFGRIDYDAIPLDDEATFSMIRRGDTIGVFQLESPAQRALQARLGATGIEDLVASVALIRPGPILGNMVDPFIARRHGREQVTYLHPKLEPILGKTYGVVLFQEQVIEIATAIAGFTPGEADELRRVMSHARNHTEMERIGELFMQKAVQSGIAESVAATIFSYIQSYASYGFCEAHAAAFATTAYKTAYLVQHVPALFYASILNQLPMGYYPVHVICAEAKRRGIRVLPIDINESMWDCTVPSEVEIRLGMRLISRFPEVVAAAVNEERIRGGPFRSAADLILRVPLADRLHIEHLVRVGALDRIEEADRNELIWLLPQWFAQRQSGALPLLHPPMHMTKQPQTAMRPASLAQRLAAEYTLVGVGMSGHWLDLYRRDLQQLGYITIAEAFCLPDGDRVTVAGLAIRPHRPPTKSGRTVVFFTLEDETGMLDATMFESVYRTEGAVVFTPYGRLLGASGIIQRRGGERGQLLIEHIWALS